MVRVFLFSLVFTSIQLIAQKPMDLELWTGGKASFKFNKKLLLDFREQIRFNDDISTYKKSFSEIGLKYNFIKSFSLKPMYRLTIRPGNTFDNRISLNGNLKRKRKGFPLILKYRFRFQHRLFDSKTYWRNKLEIKYKLSKLVDPFMAFEIFFRFNGRNEFRRTRFTVGLDWRASKNFEVSTYYRLQDEIFQNNPQRQHIIGLVANYKIPNNKKKTASSLK